MNHSEQNTNQTTDAQSIPKSTNKNVIIGLAIGAVAIIIIILAAIFMAPKKINLNDYVSVEFTGYNSMGNAYVTFDNAAFHADYDEEMKFTKEAVSSGYTEVYELFGVTPAGACLDSIDVSLSQSSDLSNGMTVTLVWNCDDSLIEEMFNCVVVYEPTDYTVEGLEDVEIFDPFENVEISFSGISPDGAININNNDTSGVFEELYFTCDPSANLSNGDTVTVSLSGDIDPITYCTENYGSYPGTLQKEYTVEGLDEYITSLQQLTQDSQNTLIEAAVNIFNSEIVSYWGEQNTINEIKCLGLCLLTPLEGLILEGEDKNGFLYVVFEIDTTLDFVHDRTGAIYSTDKTFYYYVKFPVPTIDSAGDITVNVNEYTVPLNEFYFSIAGFHGMLTPGYDNYHDFTRLCIMTYGDEYNSETTIEN